MSGAKVTLQQGSTGLERQAVTADDGAFQFTALPPDRYDLRVEKSGFKVVEKQALSASETLSAGGIGLVKPGKNEMEVDVTNTWVNRLIGDAGLPDERRLTKTIVRRSPGDQGRYAYLRGYLATDPLLRSGLLGPVRLEFGEQRDIHF